LSGKRVPSATPFTLSRWFVPCLVSLVGCCTLLLGHMGPRIVLLCTAEALAVLGLWRSCYALPPLSLTSRLIIASSATAPSPDFPSSPVAPMIPFVASTTTSTTTSSTPPTTPPRTYAAAYAAGAILNLLGLQFFYCSGHFCEFSGLQYQAPFIGFEHATWGVSPVLLLINTFGFTAVCAFAAPLAATSVVVMMRQQDLKTEGHGGGEEGSERTLECRKEGEGEYALKAVIRSMTLIQTLRALIAVISAAIQRRHIVVWALFAPKLAFEVAFLIVVDLSVWLSAVIAYY